jgi:NAD(P)-dependent dehydrogenase (short-subunit alcohol dehydrogenase family)
MSMNSNATPVICVTGASRGIGRAIAEAYARRGAWLLLLARSEELFRTAADLERHTEVAATQCDVACFEQVGRAIDDIVRRWGRIDALVNAAAILGATGEIWTTDPAQWVSAINANLIGTYNTMRAAIPHMIKARTGKIVNFAGGGAAYGYPLFSAYGCSKAAVVRLTETVASECEPFGIRVNAIAPGAIETDMLRAVRKAGGEVRTVGTMQQVVDLVQYLIEGDSGDLTGRFIHARDPYREFSLRLPADQYTLRRVQP